MFWRNFVLFVNNDQLILYVHFAFNRKLFVRSKQNVSIIRGSIISRQIDIHKSLYINVIFIQFCEIITIIQFLIIQFCELTIKQFCEMCRRFYMKFRFFSKCRRTIEHFDKTCVNCKWRDYVNRCFVRFDTNENDNIVYFELLTLKIFFKIDDVRILFDSNHDADSKSNVDHF